VGKIADKQIYKIFKTVMYHAQYRQLAEQYNRAVRGLQIASQTFSQEQWEALRAYQSATTELCCQMIKLALKKNR